MDSGGKAAPVIRRLTDRIGQAYARMFGPDRKTSGKAGRFTARAKQAAATVFGAVRRLGVWAGGRAKHVVEDVRARRR